jgi:hypothetical protein
MESLNTNLKDVKMEKVPKEIWQELMKIELS